MSRDFPNEIFICPEFVFNIYTYKLRLVILLFLFFFYLFCLLGEPERHHLFSLTASNLIFFVFLCTLYFSSFRVNLCFYPFSVCCCVCCYPWVIFVVSRSSTSFSWLLFFCFSLCLLGTKMQCLNECLA